MKWLDGNTDSMDMCKLNGYCANSMDIVQTQWILCKLREIVRTGKPGVLQFMGSQRVGQYLATEQQQAVLCIVFLAP